MKLVYVGIEDGEETRALYINPNHIVDIFIGLDGFIKLMSIHNEKHVVHDVRGRKRTDIVNFVREVERSF